MKREDMHTDSHSVGSEKYRCHIIPTRSDKEAFMKKLSVVIIYSV